MFFNRQLRQNLKEVSFMPIFLFRAVLLLACFLVSINAVAGERPNIIIVMADDVGFDAVGAYGGESTLLRIWMSWQNPA